MDKLVVSQSPPLRGAVAVSGAKNAVLPILAATLLTDEGCVIEGAPDLKDVATMCRLMSDLGVTVSRREDGALVTRPEGGGSCDADYDIVRTMRASITVLGPLLAKRGRAVVSFPGGCNIGPRPIDLHIRGLRALGATIEVEEGYLVARAGKLTGTTLFLGGPFGSSVTGTANVLMAAVLSEGRTVIESAACEPEVVDLARFLVRMGARIRGVGSPRLEIEGVRKLHGATWRVIPDRIEAGTLLVAAAITGGDVTVTGASAGMLTGVLQTLREIGVTIEEGPTSIRASRSGPLRPAQFVTLPYPGFPTDLQAQFMALLCLSEGISVITEKIYPERFLHVAELLRLRAHILREGPSAIVVGVPWLSGAKVMASDLRASAALVLAGLVARGKTEVKRIYHLDRGYERLEEKLKALGAIIEREPDPEAP
ncbi:MAG: UDP-N-acetylglucosamine 1-carboxyvinyltransferase [Planctomycetes bacterium]|jgi:UDP-N-acetylglucosamine 1-carboxyvinyltransferase|nr:UDP-N-acetylglucosamine 1-carboxyvinyltransferase [Planctomycetota bacterium]